MALEADDVYRLDEQRIIVTAVHVVATGAFHAPFIHDALDKIVSLHAVFVGRTIWKMCECGLTQFVSFEFPVILQFCACVEPDRPVVVFAFDRVMRGCPCE